MTELIIRCTKMVLALPERDLIQALIRTGKFEQALQRGKAYMIRGQTARNREKEVEVRTNDIKN